MDLKQNPFYILGVSTGDNKRKIMEAAEEKMLHGEDENVVEDAKNALLDSRRRLGVEVAWFPYFNYEKNNVLLSAIDADSFLTSDPIYSMLEGYDVINSDLWLANQCPSGTSEDQNAFSFVVSSLAELFEKYAEWGSESFYELLDVINYTHSIAGFTEITEEELLAQLDTRRDEIVSDLRNILNELPRDCIIQSMAYIASYDTRNANDRAPLLIESLIDAYEIEVQPFINKQDEKLHSIFDTIMSDSSNKYIARQNLPVLIDKIFDYVLLWSDVVKPIQIISLSKGEEHDLSHQILSGVRGVCLTANNEFDMPTLSLNLLTKLSANSVFEYMPSFQEIITSDIKTLRKIIQEQEEYERQQREEERAYQKWARSIYYETEIGFLVKKKLKLSVDGIEWEGRVIPLGDITGISWGAIRKSVCYIPSGTSYKITLQTINKKIELAPDKQTFIEIIDKIWKAFATSIITGMLKKLKNGETLHIGEIECNDKGIFLKKSEWSSSDRKFFFWNYKVQIYSRDGNFIISCDDYSACSTYMNDLNTHFFEAMITRFIENFDTKHSRLSSLLEKS